MTEQHTVWASHCPEYSSINSPTTGIYLEQFQSPIVLHCVKTYTVTLRTDSRSELVYREHCLTLTWVLAAAQALCGLGQPEFSLPPQLSRDGTLPPLSPDGSRTHVTLDSKSVRQYIWLRFARHVCVCEPTVSSPDLLKGHQPLALFCWKMEILSSPSVNMSALHDFAVFAPRGKPWRSNSTVPTHTRHTCTVKYTVHIERDVYTCRSLHTPRKSSEDSVSKSQTCRMRMAGSFCSVLSRDKMLSLFLTTTTWERKRKT